MDGAAGSITLKPNKPEPFGGKRDFLTVNTWLYKVEQYLALVQISNPAAPLTEGNRIMYASTLLTGTAAVWWYTVVQSNLSPGTWIELKAAVVREFVPEDHIRRVRYKLCKLGQTGSVSKYLSDFRNFVLTIPEITDGEKWDKFCAGLKLDVRFEVMKTTITSFQEAAKAAIRVDSALWSTDRGAPSSSDVPTPMEIGNVEKRRVGFEDQSLQDYKNNACFTCHKVGCRPWKHTQKKPSVNNVEFATPQADSDSNGSGY